MSMTAECTPGSFQGRSPSVAPFASSRITTGAPLVPRWVRDRSRFQAPQHARSRCGLEMLARFVEQHMPARDQEWPSIAFEEESAGVGQWSLLLERRGCVRHAEARTARALARARLAAQHCRYRRASDRRPGASCLSTSETANPHPLDCASKVADSLISAIKSPAACERVHSGWAALMNKPPLSRAEYIAHPSTVPAFHRYDLARNEWNALEQRYRAPHRCARKGSEVR